MRARIVSTILGCVIITALLVPTGLNAQGISANSFQNWNFLGAGARARGMGGAFLGVSNDYSAATWNPAGLIYNEGVSLSWNYSTSHIGLGLDNTPLGPTTHPTQDRSSSDNMGGLSSASFLAPLTLREHEFVLSAYYHRVQDVFARGEFLVDLVDTVRDANGVVQSIELGTPFTADFDLIGNVAYVGAAFGTSIATNLTFGANLNIVTGDAGETHRMKLDLNRFSPTALENHEIRWTDKSDIDYSGLNFTIGTMYVTDRWTASLVFTPGWTLTQNLDYIGRRVTTINSIPEATLGIVPGPDGTNREIQIPYTVGLGGSYRASENLLIAADYQIRAFSREGEIRYESDPVTPDSPFESQNDNFYNLSQLRLGAEYVMETSWGVMPFRLGLRNDPQLLGDQDGVVVVFDQRAGYQGDDPARQRNLTPRDDYFLPLTVAGTSDGQINPITFTFGSGLHWSQIHLDFALELTGYKYEETGSLRMIRLEDRCDECTANDPRKSTDDWGDRVTDEFGPYKRTYEDNRVRFTLNFTGYF